MDEIEFMKALQERLGKMEDYDKKTAVASSRNKHELSELVELVNQILKKHHVTDIIDDTHIRFFADFIGNILFVKDKKLSKIIFDYAFPVPSQGPYYHFTSFSAAKNIVSTQKIRLSNLRKRFQDGEYSTFYTDHGMDGYKNGGTVMGIDCREESIMSDIFFLSLSSSGTDSGGQSKWTDFGENGEGVRIELDIVPKHDDFREVYYSLHSNRNCIPLLKDLFIDIMDRYGIPLNFTLSSKIGAFYIKGQFANENEYRFLIKRTSDDYSAHDLVPTITDSTKNIGYIEIPLHSQFADFRIVSIQPGYNCSDDDIAEIQNVVNLNDPTIIVHPRALDDYGF